MSLPSLPLCFWPFPFLRLVIEFRHDDLINLVTSTKTFFKIRSHLGDLGGSLEGTTIQPIVIIMEMKHIYNIHLIYIVKYIVIY